MRWDLLAFFYLGSAMANFMTVAGCPPTDAVVAVTAGFCVFAFLMDRRGRKARRGQ